jgi:hypothetical protein
MARTQTAQAEGIDPAIIGDQSNGQDTETGTQRASRKGIKKGPSTVFVKYEVIGPDGQPASGYKARFLDATRNKDRIVEMTLNDTLDGLYMQVKVPNALPTE